MKRVLLFSAVVMVFLASSSAFAQMGCMMPGGMGQGMGMMGGGDMPMMGQGMMGQGMMGQGMMGMGTGGMMGGRGMMMGRMMERMMDEDHPMWMHLMGLGLDDKQKSAIMEIKSRLMKETIRKKADLQIAALELEEMLDKEPLDLKAVEAALKKIGTLKADIMLSHIKAKEEIKSKLTPEQRKKLDEIKGMRPGMGMGMMPGKGMMPMMQRPSAPETRPGSPAPHHN